MSVHAEYRLLQRDGDCDENTKERWEVFLLHLLFKCIIIWYYIPYCLATQISPEVIMSVQFIDSNNDSPISGMLWLSFRGKWKPRKLNPSLWGTQASDKLMEINWGSLIKAIIKYVCWSCIDWKTVWVTAMLTSGAVSNESWWVGLLKHPLCHLSYSAFSLWSAGTLWVTCRDTVEMIHKISRFTHLVTAMGISCKAFED